MAAEVGEFAQSKSLKLAGLGLDWPQTWQIGPGLLRTKPS
jgi:hypothetical protein